ncbi:MULTISPECIES: methylmalonyl Co-A mutase-associated GTPase MeaB [Candidatus Nitrosocaldus]|uniref:Putative enzyme n=1 Tax=Candidatus Nitrosocaldus cavascurensis TaxID=2058097 RepID=A0A2K5ASE3_9ARCH|nr:MULTISPECIES: methylmalonyl Co-A mutase-associated GTPase MeaB [Candidatus Nitrosocaldus]SPC34562.1 putative enzyme [Candidatus Nitrosocaldus cavascurensis]
MANIVDALLKGERWAIAKAISILEDDGIQAREIVEMIFKHSGNARVIGVTGPAGAGKSTLVGKMIGVYRARGFRVGVLAVDPSSSISGGAILGDRVRMQEHALDDGTYIRSMASRGASGGISAALRDAIRVLDVAGFNRIIVESVGAGQLDVKISSIVDLTIVVLNPQTGDSIQAIKAGLTEIGDIYVVNKADISGANALYNDIKSLVVDGRDAIALKTVAVTGKGVDELIDAVEHSLSKKLSNGYKEMMRKRVESELMDIILSMLSKVVQERIKKEEGGIIEKVLKKEMDPYNAAESIVAKVIRDE